MNRSIKPTSLKQPKQSPLVPEILAQANAHWHGGRREQAERLCQQVLALVPGQSDALHLLGLISYKAGNLELAILHLRQACRSGAASAIYLSNFAEICRQRGLLGEGEEVAKRAVARDATNAGAWNNLGIILQEIGKLEESKQCLERALKLQPRQAATHNNLGNTCKRLGLAARAEYHWQQALTLKPDYAEPHSNLTKLFSEYAQYTRAIEHGRRALELKPNLPEAYINLSAVETARQNYSEALRWLDALLLWAPQHASGLAGRALTLKQLDRLDEALDSVKRALAVAPNNAEVQNAYGVVLQAMGQIALALDAFDLAVKLPGTSAEEALINRAILFMEYGETKKAEIAATRSLQSFPRSALAWFNYSNLKKFSPGATEISAMQDLLKPNNEISPIEQRYLHFALGKAFLDIEDAKQAFEHLNRGNRLKRATIEYDAIAASEKIQAIKTVFSGELVQRLSSQGVASTLPIFVLGMPRSGTTLVEQVLASHPAIHGAGELKHIQDLVKSFPDFQAMARGMTAASLEQLGKAYLAKVTPIAQGRQHVVDKMPGNFMYAGLIHLMLPQARIIHCRRDPVDTCLSCYSKLFAMGQSFSYDQTELGQAYRDYQMITAHWQKILPATHFIEVDYEAVVEDLETQARRLLTFLGLEWDPACLDFYQNKRAVRTASVNQVRQPIYRSSRGRWHQYADELTPLLQVLAITP